MTGSAPTADRGSVQETLLPLYHLVVSASYPYLVAYDARELAAVLDCPDRFCRFGRDPLLTAQELACEA
jgi:hypothetical protein